MDFSLSCPRPHLRELLLAEAGAVGAMAALGIEREVLVLCAERQRLVEGLLTGERRLAELLPRSRVGRAPVPLPPEPEPEPEPEPPVAEVPEPQPEPETEPAAAEAAAPEPEPAVAEADPAPPPLPAAEPAPPPHGWFWMRGTGTDLRAGLTDGAEVWFVRAGDAVPGLGTVARIRGAPRPGVWLVGAADPLPHRPHPSGAR